LNSRILARVFGGGRDETETVPTSAKALGPLDTNISRFRQRPDALGPLADARQDTLTTFG